MSNRPEKPPVFAPKPANDNGGGATGHDRASAAAPCESRTTSEANHPSVLALAAILGRQSARQWMQQWMRDAANDNEPEEKELKEDTEP